MSETDTKRRCRRCGRPVVWDEVLEAAEDLFRQVDTLGEPSLTEDEQMIYLGLICADCVRE